MTDPTEIHQWLAAQVQAMYDLAQAADRISNPSILGELDWYTVQDLASYGFASSDAAYIAAHNPAVMASLWTATLGMLERHAPVGLRSAWLCQDSYAGTLLDPDMGGHMAKVWPCPEILAAAAPFRHLPDCPTELHDPDNNTRNATNV